MQEMRDQQMRFESIHRENEEHERVREDIENALYYARKEAEDHKRELQ
jgi:hypothetical protein